MKPQILGAGVVVALVIIIGAFFLLNKPESTPSVSESPDNSDQLVITDTKSIDSAQTIGGTTSPAPASLSATPYQPYSKTAFDGALGKRRVLYFYATWCPECKTANAEFEAKANQVPNDIAIFRVNYNDPDTDQEEKVLAGKYFITTQHVFVQVDDKGLEITKWHGGALDKLLAQIK